jgi:FkbM family methyltransferase
MRLPHALGRSLSKLLRDTPLIYVDCGARAARLPKAFRNLKNTRYIGIDADADECLRLNQSARPGHLYLPAVLGSSSSRGHFHVTRAPACSSLLRPDHEFLSEFGDIAEGFTVERQIDVETTPLDTCLATNNIGYADVVELDTQGSELDVLRGAKRILQDSVVAVQAEVEFAPMYAGQPLFADVDAFMRAQHFQLFDLSRYRVRRSTVDPAVATRGQLLWGHALYLRDHRRPQPAELSARLAVVAALLDLPDLAVCILDRLAVEETDKSLHMAVRRARGAICASITPRGFRRTLDQLAMMRETVAIRLFGDGPARRRGVPVWRD